MNLLVYSSVDNDDDKGDCNHKISMLLEVASMKMQHNLAASACPRLHLGWIIFVEPRVFEQVSSRASFTWIPPDHSLREFQEFGLLQATDSSHGLLKFDVLRN